MNRTFSLLTTQVVLSRPSLLIGHVLKVTQIPMRTKYYSNRHRDPKYRTERSRKVWRIDLPDFDHMRREEKNVNPDIIRAKLKEKGIAPPNPWEERSMYAPSTELIFKPYEPPEGEGKSSSLIDKVKRPLTFGKDAVQKRFNLNTIRGFEGEEFNLDDFTKESVQIYIKAHECLAARDDKTIFEYVTEHCFPMMTTGLKLHTIVWKYLGEVEPARAVQVHTEDQLIKNNKFAQITVRMHTKQIMAIYDRHGRLIHGSPTDVKEVLEYIVFEKYLSNEYGQWRVHDRIRPDVEQSTPAPRTRVLHQASH